jgi:hypothetical protein
MYQNADLIRNSAFPLVENSSQSLPPGSSQVDQLLIIVSYLTRLEVGNTVQSELSNVLLWLDRGIPTHPVEPSSAYLSFEDGSFRH